MFKRTIFVSPFLLVVLAVAGLYGTFSKAAQTPKQYIAIFKIARADFLKSGPKPEDMPILTQHRDYWQKFTDQGVCQLAGHTLNNDESAFGISIVRVDTQKSAQKMMDDDPMVKAGILSVTVFPFEGLERKTGQ